MNYIILSLLLWPSALFTMQDSFEDLIKKGMEICAEIEQCDQAREMLQQNSKSPFSDIQQTYDTKHKALEKLISLFSKIDEHPDHYVKIEQIEPLLHSIINTVPCLKGKTLEQIQEENEKMQEKSTSGQ